MGDLQPLFEKYGDVGDVYIPLERGSGRSRGFAFVRYYDKRDAEDAMDALNGRTYDGRDLRITIDPGRPSVDEIEITEEVDMAVVVAVEVTEDVAVVTRV